MLVKQRPGFPLSGARPLCTWRLHQPARSQRVAYLQQRLNFAIAANRRDVPGADIANFVVNLGERRCLRHLQPFELARHRALRAVLASTGSSKSLSENIRRDYK